MYFLQLRTVQDGSLNSISGRVEIAQTDDGQQTIVNQLTEGSYKRLSYQAKGSLS